MSEAASSEHKAVLAHSRTVKCVVAWAFTITTLSILIYGAVRYETLIAANVDWPILLTLNQFVLPGFVNRVILGASGLHVLSGAFLVGLFWYLWFETESDDLKTKLLLGLGAAVLAGILSRVLQVSLPAHLRPLHDPVPGFKMPPGIDPSMLNGWGSFPSDHACLYFALTAVIWLRSRRVGLLALLIALYGNLPRIYLGLHYFSDFVFGALLGIALVVLIEEYGPTRLARLAVLLEHHKRGLFHFFGFLLTLEVATLFGDLRKIGTGLSWIGVVGP
jgi:membrane-associated phospholipid phosphatase